MKAISSPNIAFIKYWGKDLSKKGDEFRNLPLNPSISMTLNKAKTFCEVKKIDSKENVVFLNNLAAGQVDFEKVSAHLKRIENFAQKNWKITPGQSYEVKSENNFPLGTGLASSASAYAALTLASLGEMIGSSQAKDFAQSQSMQLTSLARQGSGSASRSIEGPFVKWEGQSAHKLNVDWPLLDTILIFSTEKKKVSSSDGHLQATSSPFFEKRLAQLPQRIKDVEAALKNRNMSDLGQILENEALELHHIAATAKQPVTYLNSEAKIFIEHLGKIQNRDFFFTLDAGTNIHLISERPIADKVRAILRDLGQDSVSIWEDGCGKGSTLELT